MSEPTLTEIAKRIDAHLRRMERDPIINVTQSRYGTLRFYSAGASRAGRYVSVCYVSYRGSTKLTRDEATRYLAALDGGFNGQHWHVADEPEASR